MEYSTYNKTMKGNELMYTIQTEYTRLGQYMYLNYISFNNGFNTHNDTGFKVIEYTYRGDKKAFVLDLNSIPKANTVMDTSNYTFTLDDKKLGIHHILLTGERLATIFLDDLSAAFVAENAEDMSSKLRMSVKNIRDEKNRELDQDNNTKLFQFRELFVQEIFPSKLAPLDGKFMNKNIPLANEVISKNVL
jgi:hypothetical protein